MNSVEIFEKTYKKQAQYTAFTPYRICPIGAHSDPLPEKAGGIFLEEHPAGCDPGLQVPFEKRSAGK